MEQNDIAQLALHYDSIGRQLAKTASAVMGHADTDYGAGGKLKGGLMALVNRLVRPKSIKAKSIKAKAIKPMSLKLAYDPFGKQTAGSLGIPSAGTQKSLGIPSANPSAARPMAPMKPPSAGPMGQPKPPSAGPSMGGASRIQNPGLRSQVQFGQRLSSARQNLLGR